MPPTSPTVWSTRRSGRRSSPRATTSTSTRSARAARWRRPATGRRGARSPAGGPSATTPRAGGCTLPRRDRARPRRDRQGVRRGPHRRAPGARAARRVPRQPRRRHRRVGPAARRRVGHRRRGRARQCVRQVVVSSGQAVATSSTRRRTWIADGEQRHHIVDPRTGRTASTAWSQVTCAGVSALEANAASTAAVVLGSEAPEWLAGHGIPARLDADLGPDRRHPGLAEPRTACGMNEILWFVSRATGVASIVMLTVVLVLGMLTASRRPPAGHPVRRRHGPAPVAGAGRLGVPRRPHRHGDHRVLRRTSTRSRRSCRSPRATSRRGSGSGRSPSTSPPLCRHLAAAAPALRTRLAGGPSHGVRVLAAGRRARHRHEHERRADPARPDHRRRPSPASAAIGWRVFATDPDTERRRAVALQEWS